MKKKKGFTLVELLVVIAIIALLMGILMPALAKVRQIAHRLVCGTNLSGIGKAMMVYAQDNDEDYPVAGGPGGRWSTDKELPDWASLNGAMEAYDAESGEGEATIGACFYLLVKYADVSPEQFLCKGDVGATEFQLADYQSNLPQQVDELTDVWDFGNKVSGEDISTGDHYSYSYSQPFYREDVQGNVDQFSTRAGRPIRSSSNPAAVVAADRNPFLDKNAYTYVLDSQLEDPEMETGPSGEYYYDKDDKWQAAAHQREGQNVLYADIHTSFEDVPVVGINNDNIYKAWPRFPNVGEKPTAEEIQIEGHPSVGSVLQVGDTYGPAMQDEDAFLVNETQGTD